jgi:hypothetical protein
MKERASTTEEFQILSDELEYHKVGFVVYMGRRYKQFKNVKSFAITKRAIDGNEFEYGASFNSQFEELMECAPKQKEADAWVPLDSLVKKRVPIIGNKYYTGPLISGISKIESKKIVSDLIRRSTNGKMA